MLVVAFEFTGVARSFMVNFLGPTIYDGCTEEEGVSSMWTSTKN